MSDTRITIVHNRGEAPYSVCRCGARGGVLEDAALCQYEPEWLPGPLREPCTCPRCSFCSRLLDTDGRCENLDCKYVGPPHPGLSPGGCMPHRALSPCTTPGCPTLVDRGACDLHRRTRRRTQAQARRTQGDPSMGGGKSGAYRGQWPKRRAAFIEKHPTCVDCGAPSTEPDHVPPRQLLVALGIHDPDDEQWLRPRCKSDHSRVTATRDIPLLARWRAGADPAVLAEEAIQHG